MQQQPVLFELKQRKPVQTIVSKVTPRSRLFLPRVPPGADRVTSTSAVSVQQFELLLILDAGGVRMGGHKIEQITVRGSKNLTT